MTKAQLNLKDDGGGSSDGASVGELGNWYGPVARVGSLEASVRLWSDFSRVPSRPSQNQVPSTQYWQSSSPLLTAGNSLMLRIRSLALCSLRSRYYATTSAPHALVLLEHRDGAIESGSLSAVTAAQQLGGQVTGLVVGGPEQVQNIVQKAKK